MLLAEANQWRLIVRPYFGDATNATWPPLSAMPGCSWRFRQENRHPIVEILRRPDIPRTASGKFLRNHDELTLELVTDEERDSCIRPTPRSQMRINVGIRRRPRALMETARRRMSCSWAADVDAGTPIIYYATRSDGRQHLPGGPQRRTDADAVDRRPQRPGFSKPTRRGWFAPPIMDPVYGYQALNVEAQERAPFSLLNWMKRLIGLRKQFPRFWPGLDRFLPAQTARCWRTSATTVRHILCVEPLGSVQPWNSICRDSRHDSVECWAGPSFRASASCRTSDAWCMPSIGSVCSKTATALSERVPGEPADVHEAPAHLHGWVRGTRCSRQCSHPDRAGSLVPFLQRQAGSAGRQGDARGTVAHWGLLRRAPQPLFSRSSKSSMRMPRANVTSGR